MSAPKRREEKVSDSGIAEIPSSEDQEDRVNVPLAEIEEEEEDIQPGRQEREEEKPEVVIQHNDQEEEVKEKARVITLPQEFNMCCIIFHFFMGRFFDRQMAAQNPVRREAGLGHGPFTGVKGRGKKILIQNLRGLDPVKKKDCENLRGLDLVEN